MSLDAKRCFLCRNSCEPLHRSYRFFLFASVTYMLSAPQDLRCPKAVKYKISTLPKDL